MVSMYIYINSSNSSSVDARAGTTIVGAEKEGEVKTIASRAGKAGASTLAIAVALGLIDGGAIVFGSERAKLLEQKDL